MASAQGPQKAGRRDGGGRTFGGLEDVGGLVWGRFGRVLPMRRLVCVFGDVCLLYTVLFVMFMSRC